MPSRPVEVKDVEYARVLVRGEFLPQHTIAAGPRRDVLPKFPTPAGPQSLEGIALVPGALQPFLIRQTSASDDGLARMWERPDRGVNIHGGYAFQWYSIAALVVVLYVVLNLRSIETAPPRQD